MPRPLSCALPLLALLVLGACRTASPVEGLRPGEHARMTDALFPGAIPTDEDGISTHAVTRIVDARTGAPLPGAVLDAVAEHLLPAPAVWAPIRRAVADEGGWARLRVDDIRGEFDWYFVDAADHAAAADMGSPETVVRLPSGVDVPVEVRDRFDRPVPGTHLGLILGCGHTPDVRETITDEHGRAVFEDIEPGRGDLWPTKEGFKGPDDSLYFPDQWRPGDPPQVLRLTAGAWARGVVFDHEGRPAAGVFLRSHHRHRGPTAITDAKGRFLVAGLDPRDSLNVYPDPDDEDASVALADVPPPGHEMTIHLPPPGEEPEDSYHEVEFRLLGAAGETAEEIYVHAVRDGDHHTGTAWRPRDGAWSTRLPVGEYTLFVDGQAGPFADATTRFRVPLSEGEKPTLILELKPTVRVACEGFPDEAQRERSDFRTTILLATERGERDVTDLVLASVPVPVPAAAPWAFFVEVGDQARVVLGPDELDDEPLLLRAPRPHVVEVRLEDEKGRPVPGFVELDRSPHGEGGDPNAVATAHWRVPTGYTGGHYYLVARPADEARYQAMVVEIELPRGEGRIVDAGTVRFLPQGAALLRIVHADGSPAAYAALSIGNYSVYQEAEADENGEIFSTITPLEGAHVVVSDPDQRCRSFAARLEGSRPWTLTWPAGGLDLEVVDETGQPLTTGFVVLADGAMLRASGARHELRGLDAGAHEVVVVAPGREACVMQLRLTKDEVRALRVVLGPVRR